MHDLMHDLAILVSGTESAILNSSGENVIEKVHHVFDLVDSPRQFSIPMANKRKIRTILAASIGGKLGNLTCDALISNLNYLRTLDLSCFGLRLINFLRHMPLGLGHLISLEILTWFVVRQGGSKAKSGGGLSELKELSNLGGSLLIVNLGLGKDDMVECKATNMKQKQHLQELRLQWNKKRNKRETKCYDDRSLEGLQPHPNLKRLKLWYYMSVRIPSWISSLTNLVHFELYKNRRLQHLPPLNQLPFLKLVYLWGMEALEYISDEDSVSNVLGASSSSSSKTPFFPSLSSLFIADCPKLKGWWRNEPHHLLLPSFPPSLSELYISECPNLTSMPLIPDLISLKVRHIGGCPLLRLHEGNSEDCPK